MSDNVAGIHEVDAILSAQTGRTSCICYIIIPRKQADHSYPGCVSVVEREGRCKERATSNDRGEEKVEVGKHVRGGKLPLDGQRIGKRMPFQHLEQPTTHAVENLVASSRSV